MRLFKSKAIRLCAVLCASVVSGGFPSQVVWASDPAVQKLYQNPEVAELPAPMLIERGPYSEFTEGQFLFSSGALLNSQFLFTKLPFSKHHGIQISSLKLPGEDSIVIKNGRRRSGWSYDEAKYQATIFQHELRLGSEAYLKLHNTKAEVAVSGLGSFAKFSMPDALKQYLDLPEISLFMPLTDQSEAAAKWRPGPEIDGPGPDGPWLKLGKACGSFIHTALDQKLKNIFRRWLRFDGLRCLPGNQGSNKPQVNIQLFEMATGKTGGVMTFYPQGGQPEQALINDWLQTDDGGWSFTAEMKAGTVKGEIQAGEVLENFRLKDHMSFFEKTMSGSMGKVVRNRMKATYQLKIGDSEKQLTGEILMEDIQVSKKSRKKR